MRHLLIIVSMAFGAFAGTTNVRIYHQATASPAGVQPKQIGVSTASDADLGYKPWFGKDADGNLTYFLAKDKNARLLNVRQDTTYSKFDTSKHYRAPLANFDSSKISGLNATRFYFGMSRGDSSYSYKDTAKVMKADSGNFTKLAVTRLTGATKLSADTIGAIKLMQFNPQPGHFTGDGTVYYDSIHRSFETFSNGITGTLNRCVFAQTDVITDSGTTAEVSLKGNDSICLEDFPDIRDSLEAGWFKKGKRLRFGIAGIYQNKTK
jgi:hypothetical protein